MAQPEVWVSKRETPSIPAAAIAANLRRLRTGRNLSLQSLADASGLGKSTLAQVEAGRANPSLETLWSLAAALKAPFSALVDVPLPRVRVVRRDDREHIGSSAAMLQVQLIAAVDRRAPAEMYQLDAQPVGARTADGHADGTEEHLLVVSGRMSAGPVSEPAELGPGDSLSYEANAPHIFEALEPGTCAILLIVYP